MRDMVFRSLRCMERRFSSSVRPKALADEEVIHKIEQEEYKPRHHPGIVKVKTVSLPDSIINAINKIAEDHPIKALADDANAFARHLKGKVPPMEADQWSDTKYKLYDQVLRKETDTETQNELQFQQKIKDKVNYLLKKKVYNWSPVNYNIHYSLLYLFARSAPEFAVLTKIFKEINQRDENFKPKTLFDFGSGVGTVSWAANLYWKPHLFEYFNVDISPDMNDLAQSILQGGRGIDQQNLKGVFYRQFLPARNTMYDLVVSAYSLLELPSFESRMETVLRLWNKTGKYLVIVENGTNAGFKVINEARDFILKIKDEPHRGHVFSPCPHDLVCPRFFSNDSTPCNFEVAYNKIPIGQKIQIQRERYSFVVLKKGNIEDPTKDWPRIVRETLVRSKHSICRVCTAKGKLSEVVFTASKHGKTLYHCARSSNWGDRLPVILDEDITNKSKGRANKNNDIVDET